MRDFYKWLSCFLFALLVASNLFLISKYERLLAESGNVIIDGFKIPKYTRQEVINKIKELPNYQLDSIIVYEDGVIASNVPEIQGGISHTYLSNPVQLEALKKEASYTKQPLGFLVYKHVIPYYIKQFGSRRDSIH